ncbi:hypothetical protein ILYODFUR_029343 [Ilyodon furcidens]|uniref:Secreted protein n=1 Tax=Ilyodon furcidens TaxID=33524 RepID=A0ABV0V726_9TELE
MFVLIKIFYLPSCCLSVCIPGSSATQAVTSSKDKNVFAAKFSFLMSFQRHRWDAVCRTVLVYFSTIRSHSPIRKLTISGCHE